MAKKSFFISSIFLFICLLVNGQLAFSMGKKENKSQPDAINLLVEKNYIVNRDGSYKLVLFLKTKILTYKGKKDLSDFRIRYNETFENVKVISAKTITKNGKEIDVKANEIQDISDPNTQKASIFSGSRYKVINFPAVEKNSIITLKIQKESKLGFWGSESFTLLNPTKEKRVTIFIPKGVKLKYHLKSKAIKFNNTEKKDGTLFSWTGYDLEKAPDDPFKPPYYNREATLIFSTFSSWQKIAVFFQKKLFISPVELAFPQNIEKLFAKNDINKLYIYFQKNFEVYKIPFFLSNLSIKKTSQVLNDKYGTQIDIALCFFSILKSLNHNPELIAINSRGILLKELLDVPSPIFFDTFVIKTKKGFFSFDQKELPPGVTGLDGQLGLNINKASIEKIKDIKKATSRSFYTFKITSPSSFNALFSRIDQGINVLGSKKLFKHLTQKEFDIRQSIFIHGLHPLAKPSSSLEVSGLEEKSDTTIIKVSYFIEDFNPVNNWLHIFPLPSPKILKVFARLPRDRKSPLFINKNNQINISIRIKMPSNMAIIEIPKRNKGKLGPVLWNFECKKISDNEIACEKEIMLNRGIIKGKDNYLLFRDLMTNLISPNQTSIFFICN